MENAGYLFAAFGIIWSVLFGYVLHIVNTQKKLRRELDSLRETLKSSQKDS